MALDSSLQKNLVNSRSTVADRFKKLYRILYVYFLKEDFPHVKDYQTDLDNINKRINDVQQKVDQLLRNVQIYSSQMAAHIHTAPNGVTGPILPPIPLCTPTPIITPPVIHGETALATRANQLTAEGASDAPLAEGNSQEANLANIKAKTDIGV